MFYLIAFGSWKELKKKNVKKMIFFYIFTYLIKNLKEDQIKKIYLKT